MFYQNLNGIMDTYDVMRKYIKTTHQKMKFIQSLSLPSYSGFQNTIKDNMDILQ